VHGDALAPEVYVSAQKFLEGVCLLPEQDKLPFYGLLAAAAMGR
jgi:hypothetical protein